MHVISGRFFVFALAEAVTQANDQDYSLDVMGVRAGGLTSENQPSTAGSVFGDPAAEAWLRATGSVLILVKTSSLATFL